MAIKAAIKAKEDTFVGNIEVDLSKLPFRIGDVVKVNHELGDGKYSINKKSWKPGKEMWLTNLTINATRRICIAIGKYRGHINFPSKVKNDGTFVVLGGYATDNIYNDLYYPAYTVIRVDLNSNGKVKKKYKEVVNIPVVFLRPTGKRILDIRDFGTTAAFGAQIMNQRNTNYQDGITLDVDGDVNFSEKDVEKLLSGLCLVRKDPDNVMKSFIGTFTTEAAVDSFDNNNVWYANFPDMGVNKYCQNCSYYFLTKRSISGMKFSFIKKKLHIICCNCGAKHEVSFNGEMIDGLKMIGKPAKKKPILKLVPVEDEEWEDDEDDEE